jgi:hypothetical protein
MRRTDDTEEVSVTPMPCAAMGTSTKQGPINPFPETTNLRLTIHARTGVPREEGGHV